MSEQDLQLAVSFYSKATEDAAATLAEGRPIFRDVEMVKIQFPGNRLQELHAPATDTAYLGSQLGHVSYRDRFPKHYKAFQEGRGEAVIGTPLSALSLSEGRIAELRAANIKTVEMLAGLTDAAMQKVGMGTRADVDAAKAYLAANTNNSQVADLLKRIAELEAAQSGSPVVAEDDAPKHDDEFADLDEADIKATIRAAGGTVPSGNASRKTLVEALRKVTA